MNALTQNKQTIVLAAYIHIPSYTWYMSFSINIHAPALELLNFLIS